MKPGRRPAQEAERAVPFSLGFTLAGLGIDVAGKGVFVTLSL